MLPNIPGNVAEHSGECRQTFREILPNIPGNNAKHSGEYRQRFRGMLSNNPGNVIKHSGECLIYFDGREMVEASSIMVFFSLELFIVYSVIFCVKNLAKLHHHSTAARI